MVFVSEIHSLACIGHRLHCRAVPPNRFLKVGQQRANLRTHILNRLVKARLADVLDGPPAKPDCIPAITADHGRTEVPPGGSRGTRSDAGAGQSWACSRDERLVARSLTGRYGSRFDDKWTEEDDWSLPVDTVVELLRSVRWQSVGLIRTAAKRTGLAIVPASATESRLR
jgi:hypothetical protein